MAKPKPYRDTTVTVEKSERDMYRLMDQYEVLDPLVSIIDPIIYRQGGLRSSPLGTHGGGTITVTFQWPGMPTSTRIHVDIGGWVQGEKDTADGFRIDMRQKMRIAARTIFYYLKSTFEMIVASESLRTESVLFPFMVLPDGSTVNDKPDADLIHLVTSQSTPLLTARASAEGDGSGMYQRDQPSAQREQR